MIQNIFKNRKENEENEENEEIEENKENNTGADVTGQPHTREYLLIALKYGFTLFFPFLSVWKHHLDWKYLLTAFAVMLLIASLTYVLSGKHSRLAKWISRILLLIFNIQSLVLYWANSYVSLQMLTNLGLTEDLSSNIPKYIISAIFMLLFTFLPIYRRPAEQKSAAHIFLAASIGLCVCMSAFGLYQYSPYYGLYDLCRQAIEREKMNLLVKAMKNDTSGAWWWGLNDELSSFESRLDRESTFYRTEVEDHIKKPNTLPEKPNIILVLTEGFSQQIVEDPRNITPNVSALESESICFENYYNHTFATFMGLNGQFYSGYQAQNLDPNYLISLPDILEIYGYQTTFINTEPLNADFSDFLTRLGCEQVLTDESRISGNADSISDKDAYDILFSTALEQNETGQPFFIAIYTFGTHVGLDSIHEQYGDGSNTALNRFYDMDVQLGAFLEKFRASALYENTIFIFTADHATYQDADFSAAFPELKRDRPDLDRIPFLIYYKDVTPSVYDVNGRNSLDMAPTVLDFCDFSMPNYFLGKSLFSDTGTDCDYIFDSLGVHFSTENGNIRELTAENEESFNMTLAQYYSLSQQKREQSEN